MFLIDHRGRREGVIVEVLEHHTQQIVGRFFTECGMAFVNPQTSDIARYFIPPVNEGGAKLVIWLWSKLLSNRLLRRPIGRSHRNSRRAYGAWNGN